MHPHIMLLFVTLKKYKSSCERCVIVVRVLVGVVVQI